MVIPHRRSLAYNQHRPHPWLGVIIELSWLCRRRDGGTRDASVGLRSVQHKSGVKTFASPIDYCSISTATAKSHYLS